jgi:hypothetical protein
VEELKAENARLRAELEAKQQTATVHKVPVTILPEKPTVHKVAFKVQRPAEVPKKRGRPPGSKNKPKPPPAEAVDTATDAAASLESAA